MGVPLEEPIAALVAAAQRLVDMAATLPAPLPVVAAAVALDTATGELRWPGGSAMLPPVQASLAAALMRAPGAVVARAELLRALGWRADLPTRALDCAIGRLRRRMPGTIIAARGRGYRWTPPSTATQEGNPL